MPSLFKSESGKKEIFELYDQKLLELDIEFELRTVNSSFGETHVIVTGSPSNPPLIIVHGSNACAPISLETYPNLSKKYQVFAVDVLAQPNKSAELRMSMKDDSYGKWLNEVIKLLGLEKVTLVGFSFGGLVILKTLINNEERVEEVFLSAPAYIVNGNPFKLIFKVFIPMKIYIFSKKLKYVEKFLGEVFTAKDEFAIKFLSKVFLHFNMDFDPVPIISDSEAKKITTPITLIAAKQDIIFPGEKMIKRSEKIFSSLKETVLLEDSKHVQNRSDNEKIEELILKGSLVKKSK